VIAHAAQDDDVVPSEELPQISGRPERWSAPTTDEDVVPEYTSEPRLPAEPATPSWRPSAPPLALPGELSVPPETLPGLSPRDSHPDAEFAPSEQSSAERSRPRVVMPSVHEASSVAASSFDARQAHRTQAGLGPLVPAELLSVPPEPAPVPSAAPAAASEPEPAPMESKPAETKAFVPVSEPQRTLADSPDARAAAAAAQTSSQESRAASTSRETPQARSPEGKVIPFPARREDETEAESAAPASLAEAVAASTSSPAPVQDEGPISAAPNTPPMPHVLASQQASRQKPDSESAHAPAEPTVREPALERKRERDERVGSQTLQLGSGATLEAALKNAASTEQAAAAAPVGSAHRPRAETPAFVVRDSELEISAPAKSAIEDKPAARGPAHDPDIHDEFFDAGEQGLYEGGHGGHEPVLDDDLEHGVPRVIVRTPEQEQRRTRMMQVVGIVVGVVLGVLVFAVLRGRGSSEGDAAPPPERAVTVPAPVEAQPPQPAQAAPPPPEPAAPPPAPEIVLPEQAEKPAEKPPTEAARPAEGAPGPRPRPGAEPAAPRPAVTPPAQPRGPLPPPIPAGKPPTVSFPD
jgi:hypothetical protein